MQAEEATATATMILGLRMAMGGAGLCWAHLILACNKLLTTATATTTAARGARAGVQPKCTLRQYLNILSRYDNELCVRSLRSPVTWLKLRIANAQIAPPAWCEKEKILQTRRGIENANGTKKEAVIERFVRVWEEVSMRLRLMKKMAGSDYRKGTNGRDSMK